VWNISAGFTDTSSLAIVASGQGAGLSLAELPGWVGTVIPGDAGASHVMTLSATQGEVHNVPQEAIRLEDNYAAAYNANPVDTSYFSIIGNVVTVATGTIFVGVMMDFDVMFEDPVLPAAS